MSNQELLEALAESRASRRNILKSAIAGSVALAGAAILPGCGGSSSKNNSSSGSSATDILQFALNLEYLEAMYYTLGTTGVGIDNGVPGDVLPTSPKVSFSKYGTVAGDITTDEQNHVNFLRSALSAAGLSPVARPPLDLVNSFNAAANAAGLGSTFNPFANETNFILGAFIFEDVGVTAYLGGAGTLAGTSYLGPAAGIMGVEAYHAGAIRYALQEAGQAAAVKAISQLRATADGSGADSAGNIGHEHALDSSGAIITAASGANSVAFQRTPQEVLNIVYLNATPSTIVHAGGFFPAGLNGNIK